MGSEAEVEEEEGVSEGGAPLLGQEIRGLVCFIHFKGYTVKYRT